MKYRKLELGTIEAIANKLGGMAGVKRFLAGELVLKEQLPKSTHLLSMPLISPANIFFGQGWHEAFQLIQKKARSMGVTFRPQSPVIVTVYDVYFSKSFVQFPGWENIKNKLSLYGEMTEWWEESQERNDEFHLIVNLPSGADLYFYEYKGMVCFAIGSPNHHPLVGENLTQARTRDFPDPVKWKIDAQTFMDILSAIESLFAPEGVTNQCRATLRVEFLDLGLPCAIEVGSLYATSMYRDSNLQHVQDAITGFN